MSRTQTITIICWCISALVLLSLIIWFIVGFTNTATTNVRVFNLGFINFNDSRNYELVETHRIPANRISDNEIESITVDWISGSVSVSVHEGDEIIISEYSRRQVQDAHKMNIRISGNQMLIEFLDSTRTGINLNVPSKRLYVLIPYTLNENLDFFEITTVSGSIQVNSITSNQFRANTVSGRIELRDISAPDLHAWTTSGRINLSNVHAESISLRTVSGRIEAAHTQSQSIRSYTTSGRHSLSGSFSNVNARSASGRIEITSSIVPDSVVATAASGRIYLTVPNDGTVPSVQYSTGSGRFRSDIPVLLHSRSDAQFQLSTASGRITIRSL